MSIKDFILAIPKALWPTAKELEPKDSKNCTDEELMTFITKYNNHDWGPEEVHNHLFEELGIKSTKTYDQCLEKGTLNYRANWKIRKRMIEIYEMITEREFGKM